MLQHALRYRDMGLSVIPVRSNSKIPATKWLEYQSRLPSVDEINQWWGREDYNIGIVTGAVSGIMVIDCDSPSAITAFLELYKGDAPRVRTPRGMHFFFKYEEGMQNSVRVAGYDLDIRADGGYVVAPPSIINNRLYEFIKPIESISIIPNIDSNIINALSINNALITNNNINNNIYNARARGESGRPQVSTLSTSVHKFFVQGRRDDDLFHAANCLIKGGADNEFVRNVLEILASGCDPIFPEKEMLTKVQSALDRAERRERNLAAEIEEYVMSTNGHFMSTDVHKNLNLSTRVHMKNASEILRRLVAKGVIERYGEKNGCFRRVEKEYDVIELDGTIPDPLKIHYPMGIGNLCHVYEGMTTLLEGEKSRGKSAFGIEFAWLNRNLFKQKVRYMQNGELNKQTLTIRLSLRPQDQYPIKTFMDKIEFINRHREWWDIVNPTGLNIIDYIEEHEKKYLIPQYIAKIQERLTTGHALIMLQRVPGRDYGTGGAEIRNKPSVILSLQKSGGMSKVVVEDVKAYNIETMQKLTGDTHSPRGLWREYKLVDGWKFVPQGRGWRSWDDKKEYDQFRSEGDDVFVHED